LDRLLQNTVCPYEEGSLILDGKNLRLAGYMRIADLYSIITSPIE